MWLDLKEERESSSLLEESAVDWDRSNSSISFSLLFSEEVTAVAEGSGDMVLLRGTCETDAAADIAGSADEEAASNIVETAGETSYFGGDFAPNGEPNVGVRVGRTGGVRALSVGSETS